MLRQADKSRDAERWRWCDALGRTGDERARAWLLKLAGDPASSPDATAAIRALKRGGDESLLPLLGADRGGSWQLRAARVEALRTVATGDAFPLLTGYLKEASQRVHDDAWQALVAMSGRDLGDNADAWITWWKANRAAAAGGAKAVAAPRASYGTYYGIPLASGRIAFVIDTSGSMNAKISGSTGTYVQKSRHLDGRKIETRLDLAKEELAHALAQLPERTAVQLIHFSKDATAWSKYGPQAASRDAKAAILKEVLDLRPAGATNICDALRLAFDPDDKAGFRVTYRDSIDTIYLLSDGDPTGGPISDRLHLLSDIHDRNRVRRIKIHTIGLGARNSLFLRELARQSAGTYVDLAER
jgi:hypothetical protein